MTKAHNSQGLVTTIKGMLVDTTYEVSKLPSQSCLTQKRDHSVGKKLRISIAGHLLLAGVILAFAFSVVMVSRKATQSRQRRLGYCDRGPILLSLAAQRKHTKKENPLAVFKNSHSEKLALSLPTATPLQEQRQILQAVELQELYHYIANICKYFLQTISL
jgi:hypothetical protein